MMFPAGTAIRDGFGRALVDLAASNPDVVALVADLTEAIRMHWFAKAYPERFFQMGISENDMICTAAGLAISGKIPFAGTFATFATGLANLPVKIGVAYNGANVKIVTSHGGICVGADGATHQSIDDIALMRVIPGMTVLVPCDAVQAYKATFAAAAIRGPVYLRLGRIGSPVFTDDSDEFLPGKIRAVREGSDLAILSTGSMLGLALEAADRLALDGISARVLDVHTIKPLDEAAIVAAARDCGALVTVEEHSILGGLGSAVAECLCRTMPVPLETVAVPDRFGEGGEPAEILKKYGLTAAAVVEACGKALARVR